MIISFTVICMQIIVIVLLLTTLYRPIAMSSTCNSFNTICGFSVLQWNCNGIIAHQNEFRRHLELNPHKYDIICLQETFLKPGKNFSVPGYVTVRQDRLEHSKGGLLTMIKENIVFAQSTSACFTVNAGSVSPVEFIVIEVKLCKLKFKIVNIYIPPDRETTEKEIAFLFGSQTLIIGDLNAKSKMWGSPVSDGRGLMLEDLIDKYDAAVLNTGQATYQHHSGSVSHLDVAIVDNATAAVSQWSVLNNTMGSDHCPTVVSIYDRKLYLESDGPARFKLSKADWRKFKGVCNDTITAGLVSNTENIDSINKNITKAIISAAEHSIPISNPGRHKTKHVPLPFWNETCKLAVYERNCARNKLKRKSTPENIENYRRLKGQAQRVIKNTSSEYWHSYCETLNRTSNLSAVWSMAKKMNGVTSHRKICSIEYDGKIVETDEEKANIFAKNFAKISSDENYDSWFKIHKAQVEKDKQNAPTAGSRICTKLDELASSLNDEFNLCELRRAIKETKKHSTPGDDNISYEMLQHLSKRSLSVLLLMYNKVWQDGVFPAVWRHSIIKPVLKSGKPQQKISSYRPISLTSVLGKIMEKIVTTRLSYYVEKKDLLTNVQTGFRKGKSTVDQLIRLQDTINKYNNNKGYTVAVFIDFQSAYDMLWHNGLFVKLGKMGITDRSLTYIKNFLSNRTLQVRVGDKLSSSFVVKNGTPQGSIISPLLFLVMINDLPDDITQTETSLFADDSCLFTSGRRLDVILRKMQDSLDKLKAWCDVNGFKISMDKTVAVLFTCRRDAINARLKIGDNCVAVENKAKFLGLIFDSKLTWNQHVSYIVDKCKKRLNLLRAVSGNKWGASKKTLLLIYRSLIRSVIEYGSIAYDSMGEVNKRKLDSIQSQALRIVCGAVRGTATAALQVDAGEPPLQIRRLQQQIQYAAKVRCDEHHPASSVFKPHWTDRSRKYTINTNPIRNKVAEFFSENSMIKWEDKKLPSCPPWRRKDFKVDTSLSKVGSKHENPIALRNVTKDHIHRHENDLQIYTDASKTSDCTSAAFFIPEFDVKLAVLLPKDLSIFSAELIAIMMALDWVLESCNQYNIVKDIALFSDSLSSLIAIKTDNSASGSNTINEIHDIVDKLKVNIKLIWVPSHLDIVGNEMADRLARSAVENDSVFIDAPLALKELHTKVQDYVIIKWQNLWSVCDTGKFYREIEPHVSLCIKYENKSRKKETTLTRLRLGICLINEYLKKINVVSSDKCQECCSCIETVSHFLLGCPNSPLCDKVLDACARLNVIPELKYVLSDNDILNVIYKNIKRKI